MTRRRLRSLILWTGATLCVLIVAVFVGSTWWHIAFKISGLPKVDLIGGRLDIGGEWYDDSHSTVVERHSYGLGGWRQARWYTWPSYLHYTEFGRLDIKLPLYGLFLAVSIPTLLVWRFGPKLARGHCECGYNLTGNVSGTCPECGRDSAKRASK